jgi:hypothetical protein
VRVLNTAANPYYLDTPYAPDGPAPSGLSAPPVLERLAKLELRG